MAEATNHGETYHRHGDADPSEWDEQVAVTGRESKVAGENSTFADRAKRDGGNKAVQASEAKATDDDEKPAPKKATTSKATAKKGK